MSHTDEIGGYLSGREKVYKPSSLDRFTKGLEAGVIGMLTAIHKDEDGGNTGKPSFYLHIAGVFYDYFQLLSYTFVPRLGLGGVSLFSWLNSLFVFKSPAVLILTYSINLEPATLAFVWTSLAFFVVCVGLTVHGFATGKFGSMLPLRVLRATSRLMVVLLLTLVDRLASVFPCGTLTPGVWSTTTISCTSPSYTLFRILTALLLVAFVAFALVVSAVSFNRSYGSPLHNRRTLGRVEAGMVLMRVILSLVFAWTGLPQGILLSVSLVCGVFYAYAYLRYLPDVDPWRNKLQGCLALAFLFSSASSLPFLFIPTWALQQWGAAVGVAYYVGLPGVVVAAYALVTARLAAAAWDPSTPSPHALVIHVPTDVEVVARTQLAAAGYSGGSSAAGRDMSGSVVLPVGGVGGTTTTGSSNASATTTTVTASTSRIDEALVRAGEVLQRASLKLFPDSSLMDCLHANFVKGHPRLAEVVDYAPFLREVHAYCGGGKGGGEMGDGSGTTTTAGTSSSSSSGDISSPPSSLSSPPTLSEEEIARRYFATTPPPTTPFPSSLRIQLTLLAAGLTKTCATDVRFLLVDARQEAMGAWAEELERVHLEAIKRRGGEARWRLMARPHFTPVQRVHIDLLVREGSAGTLRALVGEACLWSEACRGGVGGGLGGKSASGGARIAVLLDALHYLSHAGQQAKGALDYVKRIAPRESTVLFVRGAYLAVVEGNRRGAKAHFLEGGLALEEEGQVWGEGEGGGIMGGGEGERGDEKGEGEGGGRVEEEEEGVQLVEKSAPTTSRVVQRAKLRAAALVAASSSGEGEGVASSISVVDALRASLDTAASPVGSSSRDGVGKGGSNDQSEEGEEEEEEEGEGREGWEGEEMEGSEGEEGGKTKGGDRLRGNNSSSPPRRPRRRPSSAVLAASAAIRSAQRARDKGHEPFFAPLRRATFSVFALTVCLYALAVGLVEWRAGGLGGATREILGSGDRHVALERLARRVARGAYLAAGLLTPTPPYLSLSATLTGLAGDATNLAAVHSALYTSALASGTPEEVALYSTANTPMVSLTATGVAAAADASAAAAAAAQGGGSIGATSGLPLTSTSTSNFLDALLQVTAAAGALAPLGGLPFSTPPTTFWPGTTPWGGNFTLGGTPSQAYFVTANAWGGLRTSAQAATRLVGERAGVAGGAASFLAGAFAAALGVVPALVALVLLAGPVLGVRGDTEVCLGALSGLPGGVLERQLALQRFRLARLHRVVGGDDGALFTLCVTGGGVSPEKAGVAVKCAGEWGRKSGGGGGGGGGGETGGGGLCTCCSPTHTLPQCCQLMASRATLLLRLFLPIILALIPPVACLAWAQGEMVWASNAGALAAALGNTRGALLTPAPLALAALTNCLQPGLCLSPSTALSCLSLAKNVSSTYYYGTNSSGNGTGSASGSWYWGGGVVSASTSTSTGTSTSSAATWTPTSTLTSPVPACSASALGLAWGGGVGPAAATLLSLLGVAVEGSSLSYTSAAASLSPSPPPITALTLGDPTLLSLLLSNTCGFVAASGGVDAPDATSLGLPPMDCLAALNATPTSPSSITPSPSPSPSPATTTSSSSSSSSTSLPPTTGAFFGLGSLGLVGALEAHARDVVGVVRQRAYLLGSGGVDSVVAWGGVNVTAPLTPYAYALSSSSSSSSTTTTTPLPPGTIPWACPAPLLDPPGAAWQLDASLHQLLEPGVRGGVRVVIAAQAARLLGVQLVLSITAALLPLLCLALYHGAIKPLLVELEGEVRCARGLVEAMRLKAGGGWGGEGGEGGGRGEEEEGDGEEGSATV